jgi:hypothetical protein
LLQALAANPSAATPLSRQAVRTEKEDFVITTSSNRRFHQSGKKERTAVSVGSSHWLESSPARR